MKRKEMRNESDFLEHIRDTQNNQNHFLVLTVDG